MNDIVKEDIEVTTEDKTVEINLHCKMERESLENSFDFTPYIDELGQLVLVPNDEWCGFIAVHKSDAKIVDSETDNIKTFQVSLQAHMLSDDGNFTWFENIDEIGNVVITPESENATFISIVEGSNLNVVANGSELIEEISPEKTAKIIEDSARQLNIVLETIHKCDTAFDRLSDNMSRLNLSNIDYKDKVEAPLKKFVEGLEELVEYFSSLGGSANKIEEKYTLFEGTWSLPKTMRDIAKIDKVLSKPITKENAQEVKDILYPILGNDEIFDAIDDLEGSEDARYAIRDLLAVIIHSAKNNLDAELYDRLKEIAKREIQ